MSSGPASPPRLARRENRHFLDQSVSALKPLAFMGLGLLAAGSLLLTGCETGKQEFLNAGNGHFWRGEYTQAVGAYSHALDHNASDPDVLYQIGQCYTCMRDYREAIYWYDRCLQSYPGHRPAARALDEAQRLVAKAQAAGSADSQAPAPQIQPQDPMSPRLRAERLIEVARTYETQNDSAKALATYQRAVETADDLAFTHAELGRFYMRMGQNDRAVEQLQIARRLSPQDAKIGEDLARLGAN